MSYQLLSRLGLQVVPIEHWPGPRTTNPDFTPFSAAFSSTIGTLATELAHLEASNITLGLGLSQGHGREAITELLAHVMTCVDGWVPPSGVLVADDVRADLTLQPLRWADALRPRWVVLEQVPPVLPAWQAIGRVLRAWGYSVWVGVLRSEQFGVPQTRKRAFLIARRDGVVAEAPVATHTRYDSRLPDGGREDRSEPDLFGGGRLLPWVSMAEALGWSEPVELNPGRTDAQPNRRTYGLDEPSPSVAFGNDAANWKWVVRTGANSMKHSRDTDDIVPYERPVEAPAPTVDAKVGGAWKFRRDRPSPTVTAGGTATGGAEVFGRAGREAIHRAYPDAPWTEDRPATTVVGSFRPDIIAAPGYRGPGDGPRQNAPGSVRVTIEQAAVLQSFPPDWPFQGPKTAKYRQIGNAVPPLLAYSIVRTLA